MPQEARQTFRSGAKKLGRVVMYNLGAVVALAWFGSLALEDRIATVRLRVRRSIREGIKAGMKAVRHQVRWFSRYWLKTPN